MYIIYLYAYICSFAAVQVESWMFPAPPSCQELSEVADDGVRPLHLSCYGHSMLLATHHPKSFGNPGQGTSKERRRKCDKRFFNFTDKYRMFQIKFCFHRHRQPQISTFYRGSMRNPQHLPLDHVEWVDGPLEEVKDAHHAPKPLRRSLGAAWWSIVE